MPSWVLMFGVSALLTKPVWVRLRFCLVPFLVRMWDLKACLRLSFPVPVTVKRFLALLLVFIFGMSSVYGGSGEALSGIYFFGRSVMNIRFPSSFGISSTVPTSSSSCAKRSNNFSPLLEDDAPSAEEDVRLELVALLEELAGVFHLEVEIVVVRVGTKTNLLLGHLGLVGLDFLLLLLLVVQKLLVIQNPADRRIRFWGNLHKVQFLLLSHLDGIIQFDDVGIANIVTDQTHFGRPDFPVRPVRVLFDHPGWAAGSSASNSDGAISLVVQSSHCH